MKSFFINLLRDNKVDNNGFGSIAEMQNIINGSITITPTTTVVPQQNNASESYNNETIASWTPESSKKQKSELIPAMVIDRYNRLHLRAKIDPTGMNLFDCTWGYYGNNLPVFVELPDGSLKPFILQDTAGENSNRLYKGANPSGFRATFKHRNNFLNKLQTGLMIALVMGLLFMMFIFLNWK